MACESGGSVDAEVSQDLNHTSEGMWVNFEKRANPPLSKAYMGLFGHQNLRGPVLRIIRVGPDKRTILSDLPSFAFLVELFSFPSTADILL